MKNYVFCAALVFAATPLQAQTDARMTVREARPVVAGPVVAVPRPDRPDRPDPSDRSYLGQQIRHLNQRAHNAIENGGDPERVRAQVHEYKQHLINRWKAAHGN